jgi:hypothetical protein
MDRDSAILLVKAQAAWDTYPTLDEGEVDALVDATVGYTTWTPATPYTYGKIVQPTVRNGHQYRCIVAGTSLDTEPVWPLYTAPDDRLGLTRPSWHGFTGLYPGSQVSDGETLVWIECGPDQDGGYDARTATWRAWLQKGAKASADYDGTVGKNTYNRSQVHQHCLAMARIYRPVRIV